MQTPCRKKVDQYLHAGHVAYILRRSRHGYCDAFIAVTFAAAAAGTFIRHKDISTDIFIIFTIFSIAACIFSYSLSISF